MSGLAGNVPVRAADSPPSLRSPAPRVPRVTALLVVSDPLRLRSAAKAVRQFRAQTYTRKELVVLNATGVPCETDRAPEVVEVLLDFAGLPPLGTLRNLAAAHASGRWLVPWDDDDHQHPHRLAFQMAHRRRGCAVLLTDQIRVNVLTGAAYVHRDPAGIPGTILYPRGTAVYPAAPAGEVRALWRAGWGPRRTVVADNAGCPELSVAVYHGRNVTPLESFMVGHATPEWNGRWALRPAEQDYLRGVLSGYGFGVRMDAPAPTA